MQPMNLEVMAHYLQAERDFLLCDAPRRAAEQQALDALRQQAHQRRRRGGFFRLVLAR